MGFFTTGDTTASGNYGMFDQNMALQWVVNNIASFGGDPGRIVIFGQGSGAASVQVKRKTSSVLWWPFCNEFSSRTRLVCVAELVRESVRH